MPDVTANGVRFNVHCMGSGPRTVVFVHGLVLDNLSSWFFTVASAVAAHADVVLYDLRGHGRSDQPPTGYALADMARDLAGVLDALSLTGPVTLAGNSFGGLVALAFAARWPERVESLVLVDAQIADSGFGARMADTLGLEGPALDQKVGELFAEWLKLHSARGHLDRDAGDFVDLIKRSGTRRRSPITRTARGLVYGTSFVADVRGTPPLDAEALARVRCPVLALYGEDSDVRAEGELLAAALVDCRLEIVPGCAHSVLWHATDRLREALVAWVLER